MTSKAKKAFRKYIDPNDFYLMRRRACLSTQKTAELLDVSHRTILNWENGKNRIPYTAYRVLKIKVGYLFDDEHFEDWFVRGDTLWSPEGRGFKPYELRYIGNYFWMARQWLAERRAAKPQTPIDSTIASEAASNVSPAPSSARAGALSPNGAGTRTLCGAAPLHGKSGDVDTSFAQQKRPPDFDRFMELIGFTA